MIRTRVLPVFCLTVGFALAAAAFHSSTVNRSVGSIHSISQMIEPRSGHTATLLPNGKVLIAGGMRRNQDFYKSAELYDPTTSKFLLAGEMNERRVSPIAILLRSGKVLIAGGWVGHGCTDSAELYDPATRRFTMLTSRMTALPCSTMATC